MESFKVFKNLSIVLGTLTVLMLLSGVQSVGAEESNSCTPDEAKQMGIARTQLLFPDANITDFDSLRAYMSANPGNSDAARRAYAEGEAACNGLGNPSAGDNNAGSCTAADSDLKEAINDFSAACAEAGLSGDAISCGDAVRDCINAPQLREPRTSTSPTDIANSFNNALTGQQAPAAPRNVTPDLESAQDRFAQCPVYAGEDLENWREAVTDSQTRVDELTQQVNDLQTEVTEIQTEKAAKLKEIKDQMTEIQEKAEDDAEEIRLQLQEFEENLVTQVQKLQDSISQQNQIIQQLGDAKVSAYNAFTEAQSRLNLQCHAAALAKVEQLRQTKQSLINQSMYSAGGFNNLMRSVGLSNLEASEKLGQEYYERCLNDRAYKANLDVAERAYQQAVSTADKAIAAARERINKIEDQINRVQGELKLKGLDNFARRLERLERRLITRMGQLQEDAVLQSQSYDAKIMNKQNALMQAQRQLQEAQNFLQQRQAYYDLKNQMSQGISVTAEQRANLFSKYGAMRTSASQTMERCGNSLGETEARMCRNARIYLGSTNTDLDLPQCGASSTTGGQNQTPIGGSNSTDGENPL